MQLLWERDGARRVLATEVQTADSLARQMLGLMFRRSIPEEYALVFRFDDVGARDVHMLFVRFPLDVLWVVDGQVERKEQLSPWTGLAKADADMLVELPAGTADDVAVGDSIRIIKSGARGREDDDTETGHMPSTDPETEDQSPTDRETVDTDPEEWW